MRPECRTLEELAALYTLEDKISDVFVEGDDDQSLITWFLAEFGIRGVSINTIENVEVPAAQVLERGLEDNNRGRVVTLAYYLADRLGRDFLRVTCVADSDFDLVDRTANNCALLLLTDYTSMELYCLNPRTLGKFLQIGIGGFPKPAVDVIREINQALQELFTVRMANRLLEWGMEAVSFERSCRIDEEGLHLDVGDYTHRYLNKNAKHPQSALFMETLAECKRRLTSEPRFQIHGHDFIDVLTVYIKQHPGFGAVRKDVVERALFSSLESESLANEALFRDLIRRLRNSDE